MLPLSPSSRSVYPILKKTRKKHLFHLIGIASVCFWLAMVGLLIRKVHFGAPPAGEHYETSRFIDSAEREWKEIFLKDRKVGYAVGMIKPFGGGYYVREEIFLRLNLAGSKGSLYSLTQAQVDEKFQMRNFYFLITSGVVRFSISGKMEGDHLILSTGRGGGERVQRIKMAHPPMLAAGMEYFLRSRRISVGESFSLPLLDPATLSQKEAVLRVTGKENLTLHRISYEAYRIETEVWGKPLTIWIDEKGVTLKEEGFMGFTLVRSSPSRAIVFTEGDEAMDLYEMTAVKPDRSLRDPTRLKLLKLKLEGIDEKPFLNMGLQGGRQSIDGRILTVTRESLPLTSSYSIPFPYSEWAKPYLEPEFNLESSDPEIIEKSIAICGAEKDPLRAARKLLQWVYSHIEKRPVLSVPSALETLRTGVGDCNEHATLLAALLRAVGIPARLNIGLVYSREKFYYHAWTEAYLGDWISMDAALNQMPVDATHVKFIEGNLEKQIEMVRVIEKLELKVIAFEHD